MYPFLLRKIICPLRWSALVLFLALVFRGVVSTAQVPSPVIQGSQSHPAQNDATAPAFRQMPVTNGNETITLDVSVLDRKGNPVAGLNREDFHITEDGRPVDIESFQAIDTRSSGKLLRQEGRHDSHLIFVFDDVRIGYFNAARVRAALNQYFQRNQGRLDQPTMLLAITEKGLVMLHDYTQDGKALKSALASLPAHLRILYYQVSYRSRQVGQYHGDFRVLSQIAEAAQQIPGQKTVVWISSGSLWGLPGKKADIGISDLLLKARITLNTIDPRNNLQYAGPLGSLDLAEMNEGMRRLVSRVDEAGSAYTYGGLGALALESGGRCLFGGNVVDNELKTAVSSAPAFYTLVYKPSASQSGFGFRRLHVDVNRSGLTVLARKGYYITPDSAVSRSVRPRAQLNQALLNPLPYSGLSIAGVTPKREAAPTAKSVRVRLNLDARDLTWVTLPDGAMSCTLNVASAWVPAVGYLEGYSSKQDVITVHGAGKAAPTGIVSTTLTEPLASTNGNLKIAVQDESSGRIGTTVIRNLMSAGSPSHP